jgi:hypothetical protein
MVGLCDLAIPYGLNIDGHNAEAPAGVGYSKQLAGRRTGHFTPDDHTIACNEHILDVELHVGNGVGEVADHFDRRFAAPASAGKVPGANS